jgi:tRNA-2-methylthio-N6-dimethylallyladenosine synthase
VNSYHDGTHDFADLLRATAAVDGVARIRFTSPHPADVTPRMIEALATCDAVCPQLHLPLQSASDTVLKAMNRTYDMERYRAIVAQVREAIPDVGLSTDLIVGFPGESEADYAKTIDYMKETRFDSAFLFKYSARPDTRAFHWPETVPEAVKGERLQRLIDLQQSISAERNDAWLGREVDVLVEGPARRGNGQLYGRSPQFKAVVFPDDGSRAGDVRRVRIVGSTSSTLMADAVPAPDRHAAAAPLLSIG